MTMDDQPLLIRQRCRHCHGSGEHSMIADQQCVTCHGEGFVLTDDGRRLVEALPMLLRAARDG